MTRVESDDLGLMITYLQAGGTITGEAALSIALDLADTRKPEAFYVHDEVHRKGTMTRGARITGVRGREVTVQWDDGGHSPWLAADMFEHDQ